MVQHSHTAPKRLPQPLRRLAFSVSLLGLLAPVASACPTCSVGQAIETLLLIVSFMLIPYVIATGVWIWMRRLFASERFEP